MKKFLIGMLALATMSVNAQNKGKFEVFDFQNFKVHVYNTNDMMANTSLIVEGNNGLVLMELPLFKDNAAEFETYYKTLSKPVMKVVTDYHLGGTGDLKLTMPEGMSAFIKGPVYSGMMQNFAKNFGDKMITIPDNEAEEIPFNEPQTWAGVQFTFYKGAANDFPAAAINIGGKAYYTHWTPAKAHFSPMRVKDAASLDAILAELEASQKSGCEVFIGGHGGTAKIDAVDFQIEYVKTMKKALAENKTADSFIAAMNKAYPNLPGDENLAKIAANLYK